MHDLYKRLIMIAIICCLLGGVFFLYEIVHYKVKPLVRI